LYFVSQYLRLTLCGERGILNLKILGLSWRVPFRPWTCGQYECLNWAKKVALSLVLLGRLRACADLRGTTLNRYPGCFVLGWWWVSLKVKKLKVCSCLNKVDRFWEMLSIAFIYFLLHLRYASPRLQPNLYTHLFHYTIGHKFQIENWTYQIHFWLLYIQVAHFFDNHSNFLTLPLPLSTTKLVCQRHPSFRFGEFSHSSRASCSGSTTVLPLESIVNNKNSLPAASFFSFWRISIFKQGLM